MHLPKSIGMIWMVLLNLYVNDEYRLSWEQIEKEMTSIERYSNLGICIAGELERV